LGKAPVGFSTGIAPLLQSSAANQLSSQRVIDIGTGAGFPGIPVAIALADVTVTLLDSTRKKLLFLTCWAFKTPLLSPAEPKNCQLPQHRQLDIALVRAVGSASVPNALPSKIGGLAPLSSPVDRW